MESAGGLSKSFSLSVIAPPQVTGLSCLPTSLTSGTSSNCTVTINKAAPPSLTVILSSDNNALLVPASVSISFGLSTALFSATAGTVLSNQTGNITAAVNGSSRSTPISLVVPVQLSGLSCAPGTVNAPGTAVCTVSLTGAATSAMTVSLGSGNGDRKGTRMDSSHT